MPQDRAPRARSTLPAFTEGLVGELSAVGVDVDYRTYAGADHETVLADSAQDVAGWLTARLAGEPN